MKEHIWQFILPKSVFYQFFDRKVLGVYCQRIWVLPFYFLKWNRYFPACKRVSFPSNWASIFNAIKHNSSIPFFAQILYTLLKSNLLKGKYFEIFKCSGLNLSNSSCQFRFDKSVPLQIFLHSSLSWHKTPL